MTNTNSTYSKTIPLLDGPDKEFGYEFMLSKFIPQDIKDCLFAVCNMLDIKFEGAYEKNMFLSDLETEAYEICDLWEKEYSDFDLSTEKSKQELIEELVCFSVKLDKKYGTDEQRMAEKEYKEKLLELSYGSIFTQMFKEVA